MNYDVNYIRDQFPATKNMVMGIPVAILDGPGGTQIPIRVAESITDYLYNHNANEHGMFKTSHKTEELVQEARAIYADFFGCSPDEVTFGANSTTNNFMLSHAIRRDLQAGDEVIVTDIDHTCNRSPWVQLSEIGAIIKSVSVDPSTCQLDFDDYMNKLSSKTKIVALNYASNAVGTITDVKKYIDAAHRVGAIVIIDAVHYAAHKPIDVKEIGADVLICSSYKFFGPHLGIVYIDKMLFERLHTIRVDADDISQAPLKFQTGTPNFENICGAAEAIRFIADVGDRFGGVFDSDVTHLVGRRKSIIKGMMVLDHYEESLAHLLRTELQKIQGVNIYGPPEGSPRTSTVSFTIDGLHSNYIATELGKQGIYTWDGDFYAIKLVNDVLGLEDAGGLLRIGMAPYNTKEDITRTVAAIQELVLATESMI